MAPPVFTSDSFLAQGGLFFPLCFVSRCACPCSACSACSAFSKKDILNSFLNSWLSKLSKLSRCTGDTRKYPKCRKTARCSRKESDVNTGGAKGATSARKTPWRQGGRWVPLARAPLPPSPGLFPPGLFPITFEPRQLQPSWPPVADDMLNHGGSFLSEKPQNRSVPLRFAVVFFASSLLRARRKRQCRCVSRYECNPI